MSLPTVKQIHNSQLDYEAGMHLELRHLRTIKAIHDSGGMARAAETLNITQSALSHQIRGIEEQAGVPLFVRRSKPMRLSSAGLRLLRLAEKVLPEIELAEQDFAGLRSGRAGRLHFAIECHACYEWLFPVLERFRQVWPDVDVDVRAGLAFDALNALQREEVDLVVSSDPEALDGVQFQPLFDYSPVFVAAAGHPLAAKEWISAEDFRDEVLIAYPVDRSKLDVFKMLLMPVGVEPRAIRRVELTDMILLLVAAGRGVTVLPDWVLRQMRGTADLVTRPIGPRASPGACTPPSAMSMRSSPTWRSGCNWRGTSRRWCAGCKGPEGGPKRTLRAPNEPSWGAPQRTGRPSASLGLFVPSIRPETRPSRRPIPSTTEIQRRHEQQRQQRRQQQPADHRHRHRRAELSPLAQGDAPRAPSRPSLRPSS